MAAAVASIPKEQWNQIPALAPPPGQVPNFQNPGNVGPPCFIAASVFLGVMLVFYIARVYAKCGLTKKLSWDDLTCTLSMLGALWVYFAYMISIREGPFGIHQWNVTLKTISDYRWIWGNYFVSTISAPSLGFAKMSLFLLYLQLFWPFRWLRICVYIGAPITAAFYGAVTIVQFYYLTPRDGYTPFTYLLTPAESKGEILYVPVSAVGLGVDILLLVLPVRSVFKLQMTRRKKIGLILVFLTGVLACVGSALNIYYRRRLLTTSDEMYWSAFAQLMMSIELDAGISIACMPAVSKVFQHHMPRARSIFCSLTAKWPFVHSSSHTFDRRRRGLHEAANELGEVAKTFPDVRAYQGIESEEQIHSIRAAAPREEERC